MAASSKRATVARGKSVDDVVINPESGNPIALRVDQSLREIAWRWNYALHNRSRWASRDESAQRQRAEIRQLVAGFGLDDAALTRLVEAGLVEVSIPFLREDSGWEYRIFPWEYVLAAATRARRKAAQADFTVVRHLRRRSMARGANRPIFLYVESAPPGPVAEHYQFAEERRLARSAASNAGLGFEELLNPTLKALQLAIESQQPRIVHLAGVDNHQARQLLGLEGSGEVTDGTRGRDGYFMFDGRHGGIEIGALDLARALTAARARPDLVCFNLHNSAPRVAALSVAQGARAAIGFQDSFDDALAELFFATLYRAWNLGGHDIAAAFRFAWQQLRGTGRRVTGTGIVLWNADSIAAPARAAEPTADTVAAIAQRWRTASARRVSAASAADDISVLVDEVKQLNYSMLHNNRPLFHAFRIGKTAEDIGAIDGIEVRIELHVGRDAFPFRQRVSIPATQPSVDIADRIRVSLASSLSRAVRESVHTSLLVEVSYAGAILFCETRRITLLPVDQWEDTDANRRWLPSFVLPRDPAVARVIDNAQRYLQALKDDPTAGFDGYQSVQVEEARRRRYDCSGVDQQVQAIWCALLYDTPLSYINPPPTFTDASQRLRSPSEVIDGHRGTCIDLALLVAACLEHVEIFPTIVLLNDHAFPCYWRAEEHFNEFALARSEAIGRASTQAAGALASPSQSDSWYYVKDHFREVMGEIAAGRLVALESTCLCWRNSFAQACEQGLGNLSRRSRFDSMLDVRAARIDEHAAVTPLPVLRQEA